MMDLSFTFRTAQMDLYGYTCSLYVYTFENVYALDPDRVERQEEGGCTTFRCSGLVWAGGQEKAAGQVTVTARRTPEGAVRVGIQVAGMAHVIRSTRLVIHNLRPGCVANYLETTCPEIDEEGINLHYPEAWRTLDVSMVLLRHADGPMTCLRSLDTQVRDKRFVFLRVGEAVQGELIHEEAADRMDYGVEVPEWEIRQVASLEEGYALHQAHVERCFHLQPWETRPDVPGWARDISLLAGIHGQHWSGYIFNTYAQMAEALRYLAARLDGKHILAYLPGWEGRYYWQYGDYRADERMGGREGLLALSRTAKELGVHVMPMFGINVVNQGLPTFEQWGATSRIVSASGNCGGGSVDWDGGRHFDEGFGASLNPGAPQWQTRLVHQIHEVVDTYGFDAVFLDIAAIWANDPNHNLYEGIRDLVRRIREGHEHLLVCGEGWYDGLGAIFPVFQSGHSFGPMNYHDALYPPIFDTYCRNTAHLCLGDPSRGSTGVHELGTNRAAWRAPLRKGVWPTLTLVDGTLERAPERVDEILEDARQYAEQFL